jgi:hypothetical protein
MKSGLPITFGIIGAVIGFIGIVALLEVFELGNRNDPIMSGIIALFLVGPIGGVGGLLLGVQFGRRMSGAAVGAETATPAAADGSAAAPSAAATSTSGAATRVSQPGFGITSIKAGLILVALIVAIGGAVAWYMISTATPWLNPNRGNVVLQFEVRLPPNAPLPTSKEGIEIELLTDLNRMPGDVHVARFRRDENRPVIVGEVDLAFRTAYRQVEVRLPGQPDRTYAISLTDKAPHANELGPWQKHADGTEIRYRAKWPGKD